MRILHISIISECKFTENGLKILLNEFQSNSCILSVKLDAKRHLLSDYTFVANIGKNAVKYLSQGIAVEIIPLSGKGSWYQIKQKLAEAIKSDFINSEKRRLIDNLSKDEVKILCFLLEEKKPTEISDIMKKPLFMVYAMKYQILETLQIKDIRDAITIFSKVLLIVVN